MVSKKKKKIQKCKKILIKFVRLLKNQQNHLKWEKKSFTDYFSNHLFIYLFFNHFLGLILSKIDILDIFNAGDFFQIFSYR